MFWLRFSFRSCVRRRRRTIVTLLGIAFGVAMLIVLGSIMVGVNDTMVENAVALRAGHLLAEGGPFEISAAVEEAGRWAKRGGGNPLITRALPRCRFPSVIRTDKEVLPFQVSLVDPNAERDTSPVARSMVAGEYLMSEAGLVIGKTAAEELGVGIGDAVLIMTADNDYAIEVAGIYDTGVDLLDKSAGYLPFSAASIFNEAKVTVEVPFFCPAGTDLEGLSLQLEDSSSIVTVRTWQEKLPDVAQLVDLNEFAMQIMTMLVIAILGFGVANALLISVMDRYRYYAILKAIGVRPGEVVMTVVGEAVIMCLGAGLVGTLIGVVCSTVWGNIGLDIGKYTSFNPHFSINSVVYPRLTLGMSLGPQLMALAAGALASVWPAMVAARRSVSSGMRDL